MELTLHLCSRVMNLIRIPMEQVLFSYKKKLLVIQKVDSLKAYKNLSLKQLNFGYNHPGCKVEAWLCSNPHCVPTAFDDVLLYGSLWCRYFFEP